MPESMVTDNMLESPERELCLFGYGRRSGRTAWRWMLLLIMAVVFAVAFVYALNPPAEESVDGCMGIPILSETQMQEYTEYSYSDLSENLKFQNEYAAVDVENAIIYIPQMIHEQTRPEDLAGQLTVDALGRKLFFAPDDQWDSFSEAVRNGHRFQLIAANFAGSYMRYDVVFTSVPVISMHGQLLYRDENYTNVMSGRMVLWDPHSLNGEDLGVTASKLRWHMRGASAASTPKKSWKLNLLNTHEERSGESLLHMGSDDDWILNAMSLEDSNIRDKLFIDVWNEMAAQTDYNGPMSQAEYVEVLINGEYQGLYLLQRRVDDKYLDLDEDAAAVRVKYNDGIFTYEIRSEVDNIVGEEELFSFFVDTDCRYLHRDNFVDVNLFLQLFSAVDNAKYKNMTYVFDKEDRGYVIKMVPWDTDMIMGSTYGGPGNSFIYDYEKSLNMMIYRREYDAMKLLYPDLDQQIRNRWFALREDVFSLENITGKMDAYFELLSSGCADVRDRDKWGVYYEGKDTPDKLYRFIEERIELLDAYYMQ